MPGDNVLPLDGSHALILVASALSSKPATDRFSGTFKPILTIREGQVEPFEQQRTKKRALARLAEVVEEGCPHSAEARLCVVQVEAADEAAALAAGLSTRTGIAEIPIYELPPAIVVHGGPRTMGVGFFQ